MADKAQRPTPGTAGMSKSQSRNPHGPRRASESSMAATDEDTGYESRSRSASRRRRRQNQRQRNTHTKAESGKAKASSHAMSTVNEETEPLEKDTHSANVGEQDWLKNPATQDTTEQQPFEHIKPPSQSMDGPVTYSRMMRGEIPWRGPPARQPHHTTQGVDGKTKAPDPMEQDGLKLRLELNLDIEIELKAHIHGDITLALLA